MAGKYTTHHEIRQNLGCILMVIAAWGLASLSGGLKLLPSLQGWALLLLGLALIAVGVGIWSAKEWSRWAAGLIASGCVLWGLGEILYYARTDHDVGPLAVLPAIAVFALIAWYSFRPATKEQFRKAREAIARARAVPG